MDAKCKLKVVLSGRRSVVVEETAEDAWSAFMAASDAAARVAIVRGAPVPVIDTAELVGAGRAVLTRFVSVRCGDRRVALAVDAALGVGEFRTERSRTRGRCSVKRVPTWSRRSER